MPHRFRAIFILAALLSGCGTKPEVEPLRIAAASDLQQVLPAIVKVFEERYKLHVTCTFGSSGQLAEQFKAGAPFDLFLAANHRFVSDLAEKKVIDPASVAPYAQGELVMIVGRRAFDQVGKLDDLTGPRIVSIAMANPEVAPYGQAAKQTLENAGLWSKVETKIVRAENVRQVLQFVSSGNADVGFVGSALVQGVEGLKVVSIDPALHDPIIQYLGITLASRQLKNAEALRLFILGQEAQRLLRAYGFKPTGGL